MLRQSTGARRYRDKIILVKEIASTDEYGHLTVSEPVAVLDCFACVRRMSQSRTLMTFQLADVVGLEIEFRYTQKDYNALIWRGHMVHFAAPENVDGRNMITRIIGYYQIDNPLH